MNFSTIKSKVLWSEFAVEAFLSQSRLHLRGNLLSFEPRAQLLRGNPAPLRTVTAGPYFMVHVMQVRDVWHYKTNWPTTCG